MMRQFFIVVTLLVVGQLVGNAGKELSGQDQQPIAVKLSVPDDAASAKALGTVRQVFDHDYRSRKLQDRLALVAKLLKQADDPANEAAMQYVLLTEAAQIAAEAGDVQDALDAAARKASRFEDDPLRLKLDVLSVASGATVGLDDLASLADRWTSLANEAVSAEVFDVGEKAARGACDAANRTKNKELILRTSREQQRIKAAARLFAATAEARARLKVAADDSEANTTLGRYLCFVRRQWGDGLPYLAKADNPELKAAAEADIATPETAEEQAKIADKWYQLAQQEKNSLAWLGFRVRARYWYNLALPGLAGMERAKVENRLVQNEDEKDIFPQKHKEDNNQRSTASITVGTRKRTTTKSVAWLDEIHPVSSSQGYGQLQRRLSVDGRPIKIAETTYPRGLGTHARSEIVYRLDRRYETFQALCGIDAEALGTCVFEVWADDKKLFDSGIMRNGQPAKNVDVDVSQTNVLRLVVTDAGDGIASDHADWANACLLNERRSNLWGERAATNTLQAFGKGHFDAALKVGHGSWSFERDGIAGHSWSYGLPGLLVFWKDTDAGVLQATMKNGGYAASGCQGLVMCLTKEVKEDDGYHGSAAYFVRYNAGTVELLDAIPYHRSPNPPRVLASVPAEVKGEAIYTLRMSVRDGDKITVWLNEHKVLEHTAERKLRGRYALLASNGTYLFQEVGVGVTAP